MPIQNENAKCEVQSAKCKMWSANTNAMYNIVRILQARVAQIAIPNAKCTNAQCNANTFDI